MRFKKTSNLSQPRVVLSIDPSADSITVPRASHILITVALENVRLAIVDEQMTLSVLEFIDQITAQIKDEIKLIIT